MWVDEKEIMYLIQNNIRYIPGLDPNRPLPCYDQAAHAIAEKMREGVLRASGTVRVHSDPDRFQVSIDLDVSDSLVAIRPESGQRVRVTVTREEGDG